MSKLFMVLGMIALLLAMVAASMGEAFPEEDPCWALRIVMLIMFGAAVLAGLVALFLFYFVVRTAKGTLWLLVTVIISGIMFVGEGLAVYMIMQFGFSGR